jgi:probable HAF family extracellular repeat protein
MTRAKTLAIAAVVTMLAHAHVAGAAVSYTLTDLGPGVAGSLTASGRCLINNGQTSIYDHGQMTPLNIVVGGMTDNGQFIGGITVDGFDHGALYTNGVPTDIGTLGGTSSYPNGFNEAGVIVGGSNVPNLTYHAFLYQNGQMTDLAPNYAGGSNAIGINELGQVIGEYDFNIGQHACRFDNGAIVDLGTLGGDFSIAYGINENGVIVGQADVAGNAPHAFLYDGTMHDLGTLGGTVSVSHTINNAGQVVGYSTMPASPLTRHAFLYENGAMLDLNTLIPANSGLTLQFAGDINDDGLIVGYGVNSQHQMHGFLLTPTPEPGTLSLSPLLIGTALCRRRRAAPATRRIGSLSPAMLASPSSQPRAAPSD